MDEAAFIAAILADPSDDAPRFVYAGWLEEHGQEGRGEFIRVQCELARTPRYEGECKVCCATPDDTGSIDHGRGCHTQSEDGGGTSAADENPRWLELTARERELYDAHHPAWWGEYGALALFSPSQGELVSAFHRGFLDRITCAAAVWLAHADAITAAQPVRSVTLTTWPDRSRRLSISTTGPDVVTVLVPLAGRLVESSAETEREAISEAMRQRWPGIRFHLPAIDRWGSFDVPVYDPAAHVVSTL